MGPLIAPFSLCVFLSVEIKSIDVRSDAGVRVVLLSCSRAGR